MELRVLVFGKFEKNPKCISKNCVSLILDHPSLNEAGTKDDQSGDVPPGKDKQFLQTADGYRTAIWNPRTEMQ